MMDIGARLMAQQDGGTPTTLAAGNAPGESGVSVLSVRFDGGMHLRATPRCHCICFQMSSGRVEKRMGGRVVYVELEPGRFQLFRLESIVPPMPTSASIFLRSRSIRAGWRLQPRRARCPRRS